MFSLEKLNQLPPYQVRMFARHGRRGVPMTLREIAAASGLSYRKVKLISCMTEWDRVVVGDAAAFMGACGLRPGKMWRQRGFLKRSLLSGRPLGFLDRLPAEERRLIDEAAARHAGL